MKKIEIKHLAAYLPYGLKGVYDENEESDIVDITGLCLFNKINHLQIRFKDNTSGLFDCEIKPILRPLSDLTKNDFKEELYQYYQTLGIDVKLVNYDSGNDNPFDMTLTVTYKMMGDVYTDCLINRGSTSETPYHIIVWLCENHFDIFGLIKQDLAIDINK